MAYVLIVEDEPDLGELLSGGLRAAGHEVEVAETGKSALDRARLRTPDLVLLDLMLPDMDGVDVCRRLRGGDLTRHAAVIVVSAKSDLLDRIALFKEGADDYVVKPFSFRELLLRVQAVLRRCQPGAEPALSPAKREP